MILRKETYDKLYKQLETGDISVNWDCGNDSTIINMDLEYDIWYEVYDTMVDYYNLPNATSGYHVNGNGVLTIEDDQIVFKTTKIEEDPEDNENVPFETPNTEAALVDFKFHHAVEVDFILDNEGYLYNIYIYDRTVLGRRYDDKDFKCLEDAVIKDVKEALEITDFGDNLECTGAKVTIEYDGNNVSIDAYFQTEETIYTDIYDIIEIE